MNTLLVGTSSFGLSRREISRLNSHARSAARERLVVGSLLALAVIIRLPALLNDGLWRDEANVFVQLSAPDAGEFWHRVLGTEWHPPLFFALIYCWAKLVGLSEIGLKIVPFFFSIATVALVYRLGRTTGSFATAAVSAGLYAVAPFAVAYSSEYLYPVMSFLTALLALLVLRARTQPLNAGLLVALGCATCLVVYTHYTGLVIVALLAGWTLLDGAGLRRRLGIVAALALGAFPFVLWLPVFIAQRRIGVPYQAATVPIEKLAFFVRTLAECVPVRPLALEITFVAFVAVALIVVDRARSFDRDAIALGLIFLALLGFIAAQNLIAPRYALAGYGLGCVALGSVIVRFGDRLVARYPRAQRWGACVCIVFAIVLGSADLADAVRTSAIPKSGIRSIAHTPALDATTLYVLAPDYLASTFAFYARDTNATFAGFVRWDRPEIFRLAAYATDWNRPDAVARTLNAIAARPRSATVLDVVVDDRASDQGQMPYAKVFTLLQQLDNRYRRLSRTSHPGRYEPVTEYRYALADL